MTPELHLKGRPRVCGSEAGKAVLAEKAAHAGPYGRSALGRWATAGVSLAEAPCGHSSPGTCRQGDPRAHLGDSVGLVPKDHSKAHVTIK